MSAAAGPAAEGGGDAGFSGWQLVLTSATPTLIVCMLGAVGAAMTRKGVLNDAGCQVVARLCFFVFTPALTFSKLVQAISLTSIAHLWPLLVNMTVSIVVGLGSGFLVARLTRTPPQFRYIVICSIAFGNVGNLPLVFVSTLCHDRQAVFYRQLGEACEDKGVAYTAFDIAAATLWQFTLAINLIRRGAALTALDAGPAALEAGGGGGDGSGDALVSASAGPRQLRKFPTVSDLLRARQGGGRSASGGSSPAESPLYLDSPLPSPAAQHPAGAAAGSPQPGLEAAAAGRTYQQQQQQHIYQQQQDPRQQQQQQQAVAVEMQPAGAGQPALWNGAVGEHEGDTAALLSPEGGKPGSSSRGRAARWWRAAWQYLKAVDWGAAFPLPSQAAILGIAVGCIPPLKALLYSPHPPLRILSEALEALGAGLIPTTIPLLGAVLYRGPGASQLPLSTTLAVLATRLVLQPALLTALVAGALKLRLFRPPDSMFLLTLLLSNATPTAINMQTLTVLYRTGEGEMASLLFTQYVCSILTLPAFTWVFLRIIGAFL